MGLLGVRGGCCFAVGGGGGGGGGGEEEELTLTPKNISCACSMVRSPESTRFARSGVSPKVVGVVGFVIVGVEG